MSYYFTLTYPPNLAPCSISNLLRYLLIPRKWRHFLRTEQKILINGHYRYFNQLVLPNEKIELQLDYVDSLQGVYPPSGRLPDVVYEDHDLLIINKPTGQKTHPNLYETDTALNDCTTYLKNTPFIVHRLDMLTNGLLLIAKNPAVVPILNRELAKKIFHREYLAIVDHAQNLHNAGTINLPIGHDPLDQRKRKIRNDGLTSITNYQVLQRYANNSALVKLKLETGRTHQIRVHLAALGSPIIGDPLYNSEFTGSKSLQLTAYQVSLTKPFSFEHIKVTLPFSKINLINN